MKIKHISGFTLIELIISIGIMGLVAGIFLNTFVNFKKHQSLVMDTDTVIGLLLQARNQTLSSKNASQYGVHFATSNVTVFTGSTYTNGAAGNQVFTLSSTDTILTISLAGGGSNVVFDRLTGETSQNGTVVVSSSGISDTKTVTIYKTGLVESR